MRLIDANSICPGCPSYGECKGECWSEGECEIYDVLIKAKTIDAVQVCRCKDCDKSEPSNVWDGWVFCKANKIHHKDDNFCSYGERKDGEG